MVHRFPLRRIATGLIVAVAACTGSEPDPRPTTVIVTPGSAGFDAVGATATLSAAVQDENGNPMPGAVVDWSSSASSVARVDAAGRVTAVANGTATIRASAGTASGSASVIVSQVPALVERAGGNGQSGAAGTALGAPLQVRVIDARGSPAADVPVAFAVSAGGGSVAPGSVLTDAQGRAGTTWTLGRVAGQANTVEVSLPSAPAVGGAVFDAQAVAGPPATLTVLAGTEQSAPRGTVLPTPVRVRAADAFGNAAAGASVAFEVVSGGGGVAPGSTQADAQGRASAAWTLGTLAGLQTLRASAGDASVTVDATATVVPAVLTVSAGAGQSATVATPVPIPPSVRVTDALELPAPGVSVTFTVTGGAGTLAAPSSAGGAPTGGVAAPGGGGGGPARANGDAVTVVTDADGVATLGHWTLGRNTGGNTLRAEVAGLTPVSFVATGVADEVAAVSIAGGDGQSGPSGSTLPEPLVVEVRDQYGNRIQGAQVAFAVAGGGGSLSAATATTGIDGRAQVTWTLGGTQGAQTATATAAGIEVSFTATATATPASMTIQNGDGQDAPVDTPVFADPAVRVATATNQPVVGAVVTFVVSSGGGAVSAGGVTGASVEVATDASGVARVDAWRLGTLAGTDNNTLTASSNGVADVVFTASGRAGPAAIFAKVSGDGQTADVEAQVDDAVVVQLADAFGNPVSGTPVSFSVGEGSVGAGSVVTNGAGRASTSWTLGPTPGTQELTASVAGLGLASLTFTATATDPGGVGTCDLAPVQPGYDIQLCYLTAVSASVRAAFDNAVARWETLITGDLPSDSWRSFLAFCGPEVSGQIDDLLIYVTVEPIDGEFNILGSAGPCDVRPTGRRLPYLGRMRFDEADMERLETQGQLEDVILHEMGHVLGIGTLWDFFGFLQNPTNGTPNPALDTHFSGPQAVAAFEAAGGDARDYELDGDPVPVENAQGGGGTLDGHWRESTMDRELMTGFLDGGVANPLSAITIASLADLGYTVNPGAADAYTVANPTGAPALHGDAQHIELVGDIWWLPLYVVDDQGRVLEVIRR